MNRTLKYLEMEGMRVRINTVVTSLNANDIVGLVKFLASLNNISRITLSPYSMSRFKRRNDYYIQPDRYALLKKEVEAVLEDFPWIVFSPGALPIDPMALPEDVKRGEWKTRSFCSGGRHGFVILPNGKVTMCEELYYHENYVMGDLNTQSIMEMWHSEDAMKISHPDRSKVSEGSCRNCQDFESCHINPGRCVRETIKFYGKDKHFYPDPRCPKGPGLN